MTIRTRPPNATSNEDAEPIARDELASIFHEAEKPASSFRVGGEAEKFGIHRATGEPLAYDGDRGVTRIFQALIDDHGWAPDREVSGGPIVALKRGQASITLEPGGQFELSGSPSESVHEVCAEMRAHLDELAPISRELDVAWLGIGFHPTARLEDLPWVPKQRYGVMRTFLPKRGHRALDMMQRTATVQVNLDYSSERDAMDKLVLLLRLSPLLHAMTANAPFIEGRVGPRLSERGDVWLHMDPSRSGLIPSLWKLERPTYEDYVEWALEAPMFLFRRGDEFIRSTGQTFRDFLANGYEGHRATRADWVSHVNSLFPEARLKRTLEVRCADCLPQALACSVPALAVGLVYDERASEETKALLEPLSYEVVEAARPAMVTEGLRARIGSLSVQDLAERVLDIAAGGLERRAKVANGRDERVHLDRLGTLVGRGLCPADVLVDGLGEKPPVAELVRRSVM